MRTIFLLFVLSGLLACNRHAPPMAAGNIAVPHERAAKPLTYAAFTDSVILQWANREIIDAKLSSKGNSPRIILAKLLLKRELDETNQKICQMRVRGVTGSSWALNKKGDYDFTLTPLTSILFLLGDQPDILYPETKDYLLNTLLTAEGNKFRSTVPNTLGLVKETENHLLMTEGSRYLKNHWMMTHGNNDPYFNNLQNGMEGKIMKLLGGIKENGLYEFNSLPYIAYTISALLNLEGFASEKVRLEARNVLDYINWTYALGSYQLKHYPPMRRRYDKEYIKEITTDYQSVFMKSWLAFANKTGYNKDIRHAEVHALTGAAMPYRPADKVTELIFNKGDGYFIKIGHGEKACPEIYAAGKNFLLSAGGANRGKNSMIVARPICLFLNDTAGNLSSVFHIAGPGKDFMGWNNTGVYKNFACAAGPVQVPSSFTPVLKNETFTIYATADSVLIAVHSENEFGLIAVFENTVAATLLAQLMQSNPEVALLKTSFQFPGGNKLTYDGKAPKNKWVLISDNGQMLNRDFDEWPLIDGNFK